MGLDIEAFQGIKRAEDQGDDADDDAWLLHRPEGLPDRTDGIALGRYECVGESLRFRAGSYSGYNLWREWLAKTFLDATPAQVWDGADDRFKGKPFVELINFTDCDGFIGPKTSAKLAKDFAEHAPPKMPRLDQFYVENYALWRKAFEIAAGNGVVIFC